VSEEEREYRRYPPRSGIVEALLLVAGALCAIGLFALYFLTQKL